MSGYHIQASDGTIGHVSDFIMDDKELGDSSAGRRDRPLVFRQRGTDTTEQDRSDQL